MKIEIHRTAKFKKRLIAIWLILFSIFLWHGITPNIYAQDENFSSSLEESIAPIQGNLNSQFSEVSRWAQWVRDAIIYIAEELIIPIVIIIGILIGIIWFYKLLFSNNEEEIGKWISTLLRWVVAILIMISARWITMAFVGDGWAGWALLDTASGEFIGIQSAQQIYDSIIYPLIKLWMFIILWILFVILLSRVFTFIFSTEDEARKKATTIIIRNTIGILVIIGSQSIVEAIYWQREEVLNVNATDLWQIGTSIFESRNIPIVYEVINWILGITSLIILVIILIQAFQLLTKPDDEEKIKKLGKSLLFILVGIIIIWAAYLIVNVLLVE